MGAGCRPRILWVPTPSQKSAACGILWAMNSSTSVSVEARSPAALQVKVAARKAFGWVKDGGQLKVIDFTKRRPTKRYVQMMYRSCAITFRWEAVA